MPTANDTTNTQLLKLVRYVESGDGNRRLAASSYAPS